MTIEIWPLWTFLLPNFGVSLCSYIYNYFHHSRETACGGGRTTEQGSKWSAPFYPPNHELSQTTDHNTGSYMPYSLWQVWRFFYVPEDYKHWRVVRQGLRFNRHYPHLRSTTVSLETNHLFSIASNWQISPWEMIHLLEILQSSESMRLYVRSSPHQIEVGAIWMNLRTWCRVRQNKYNRFLASTKSFKFALWIR